MLSALQYYQYFDCNVLRSPIQGLIMLAEHEGDSTESLVLVPHILTATLFIVTRSISMPKASAFSKVRLNTAAQALLAEIDGVP